MKHRKNIYLKTAPQRKDDDPPSDDDINSKASNSNVSEVWLPETSTAFRLLMSANLCSALMNNITDCDETYNYWEPLHHLLYGEGFQTWEYSPVYAIRSWAYIYIHSIFTWIYFGFLNFKKMMVFYFIRMILGIICTLCEVHFYQGVAFRFGNNVARITLVLLLFGSGMFISATAFLPSSFCMYTTFLLMGTWLQGQLQYSILAVAAGAIIGWPFSVALGIPFAIDVLIRRQKYFFFVKWSLIALLVMLLPCFLIDSYFYAKPVAASLNILIYNVFTDHGPDIYGTEPVSYYLLNGFLNFNIAFILAITSIILVPVAEFFIKIKFKGYQPPMLLLAFAFAPMYIWICIFFIQPHKEERFLYPIYPLICLCAAVTIATIQKLYCVLKLHHYVNMNWIPAFTLFVYASLSLSRSLALFQGYHSSMDIYLKLHSIADKTDSSLKVNVCVGKEWHRFPSSFFLPHNFTLQFIQSDFKGQLPQHFAFPGVNGTRALVSKFNDQNLEEKGSYTDIKKCHFLIDLNTNIETKHEPIYSKQEKAWEVIEELPFLNSKSSSSRFLRAFYLPFFFENANSFSMYQLMQSKSRILNVSITESID